MIDIFFITHIVYLIHLANTTSVPKADTTNSENHISQQDPNTLTKKFKLQQYRHFQKMLHILTIEYQLIQKAQYFHHLIKTHIFM